MTSSSTGYHAIGDDEVFTSQQIPTSPPRVPESSSPHPVPNATLGYQSAPAPAFDISSVAGNAKDALLAGASTFDIRDATGSAKDAITGVLDTAKTVELYTEPLDPASQLSLQDRFTLIFESCRPWYVFADLSKTNRPPISEVKLRFTHNVETYFYNYVVIAVGWSFTYILTSPTSVLALIATLGVAVYLHVLHPEPIAIVDGLSLDTRGKHIAVGVCAAIAVFFFGGFRVLSGVAVFTAVVVIVHALLRDHTA